VTKLNTISLIAALLVTTLLHSCAITESPPAPDELHHTTMGYRYQNDYQRKKAEENRSRLQLGMTAEEVVSLLGIPAGPMVTSAIAESALFDVHYGSDLLKFRDGRLTAYSRVPPASSYQRTVRLKDPLGTCGASCNEFNVAVRNGDVEKVRTLLQGNVDLVSSKPYDGVTPFQAAVERGDKATASLLLANKADVTAKNRSGLTPLHVAAEKGDTEMVRLLLANNADVSAKADDRWHQGKTPLYMAALQRRKEVVAILLAHGADVNVKTIVDEGRSSASTPLSLAASGGDLELASLLLANKADVNGAGGTVPLSAAIFNRRIYNGAGARHKDVVRLLLANNADVNATNTVGLTPLHFAANDGDEEIVRLLLASSADVNARSKKGETPLSSARARKHLDIVKILLEAGGRD